MVIFIAATPSVKKKLGISPGSAQMLGGLTKLVLPLPAGTPSANKLGKFLVQAQMQGSVHSSAMFLTAAAQNLLCLKLATELGVVIPGPWVTWFKAAVVPALCGLLVTPFLMYKVRDAGGAGCVLAEVHRASAGQLRM